jgi:hypothetical protein
MAIHYNHRRAGPGQDRGNTGTDATGSPGDYGYPALQVEWICG